MFTRTTLNEQYKKPSVGHLEAKSRVFCRPLLPPELRRGVFLLTQLLLHYWGAGSGEKRVGLWEGEAGLSDLMDDHSANLPKSNPHLWHHHKKASPLLTKNTLPKPLKSKR